MKDTVSRLQRGIIIDERPVISVEPGAFSEPVYSDVEREFILSITCKGAGTVKGSVFCDDYRISIPSPSFSGRASRISFTADVSGLPAGSVISGSLYVISNAGEYEIPYRFTSGITAPHEETAKNASYIPCDKKETGSSHDKAETDRETLFFINHIPEDDELLSDVCLDIIKQKAAGTLAYAFLRECIQRNIPVPRIYESFMEVFPEDGSDTVPREVLLYYSYEKNIPQQVAAKLYRSVIETEPRDSELYRLYEPYMRDFCLKNVLSGHTGRDLFVIYKRMLYPDMIDRKAAMLLPDILNTKEITVPSSSVKHVYLKYPELKGYAEAPVNNGRAYIPVHAPNALFYFSDDAGSEVICPSYDIVSMIERPDLMERCLSLYPGKGPLRLNTVKGILERGVKDGGEKELLVKALRELPLEDSFRKEVMKALCAAGGDTSWIDGYSPLDFDFTEGILAYKAYLNAGRYRDAYTLLKAHGLTDTDPADLSALSEALLSRREMNPADGGRFFMNLAVKAFTGAQCGYNTLLYLSEQYSGSIDIMAGIIREAGALGCDVSGICGRTLLFMLFCGRRKDIDSVFLSYVRKGVQDEGLLKAYFVQRMDDYFLKDEELPSECFDVLREYFGIRKNAESLPVVLLLGFTKYMSEKESLTKEETELCAKLSGILIRRDLIFRYTKHLRKKVKLPASVCEKYYIEYCAEKGGNPQLNIKIKPGSGDFYPVPVRPLYRNMYVGAVTLFYGEELQYRITDGAVLLSEGSIKVKKLHEKSCDRYAMLNDMTEKLQKKDCEKLKEAMLSFAAMKEVNRKLFEIE